MGGRLLLVAFGRYNQASMASPALLKETFCLVYSLVCIGPVSDVSRAVQEPEEAIVVQPDSDVQILDERKVTPVNQALHQHRNSRTGKHFFCRLLTRLSGRK